jgi:hypothetical protein
MYPDSGSPTGKFAEVLRTFRFSDADRDAFLLEATAALALNAAPHAIDMLRGDIARKFSHVSPIVR